MFSLGDTTLLSPGEDSTSQLQSVKRLSPLQDELRVLSTHNKKLDHNKSGWARKNHKAPRRRVIHLNTIDSNLTQELSRINISIKLFESRRCLDCINELTITWTKGDDIDLRGLADNFGLSTTSLRVSERFNLGCHN